MLHRNRLARTRMSEYVYGRRGATKAEDKPERKARVCARTPAEILPKNTAAHVVNIFCRTRNPPDSHGADGPLYTRIIMHPGGARIIIIIIDCNGYARGTQDLYLYLCAYRVSRTNRGNVRRCTENGREGLSGFDRLRLHINDNWPTG